MLSKAPGTVDIIVPVHNAWHITRKCLEAVIERTGWPYRLMIVDDASDDFTERNLVSFTLRELARGNQCMLLNRNTKNRGFAASVNRGIRLGIGEYVCLLNSDVIVTEGWLTKMVLALEADPQHAIVCPATNNTAVVEIPMSPGASYLDMNRALELFAQRRYPEINPTGFCFLFRRSLLAEVGYFDEAYRNFGEETDFWWRALTAHTPRYRAVMADDTYVFHERASSFSALGQDAHMGLRKLASGRFNQLHPGWVTWRDAYNVKAALGPLRQPVPAALLRSPSDRYRICWLVHDARACGAMRYIADLVNELCERGVNAKVAVLKRSVDQPEEWLGELRCAPIYFGSLEQLLEEFPHRVFPDGLLIASTVELAPAVRAIVDASEGKVRGCLHAQSYEPALTARAEDRAHLQALYKLLPDVIASSQWVADEIEQLGHKPFAVIHPGVDRTLFYPRDRAAGDDRPTVCIPMNPSVPWRGWDRGLELIAELERQAVARGIDLRILVYGVDSLPIQSRAICLGTLPQTRIAHLLGTEVDVLVDPSHVHSYGMPALEAAACGVPTWSFENRGRHEYDGVANVWPGMPLDAHAFLGILCAIEPPARWAEEVLEDLGRLTRLHPNVPAYLAEHHDREESVSKWIAAVESHFRLGRKLRRICVVVPHLRKWGGPTTMLAIANELAKRGHEVDVVSVIDDLHPSIEAFTQVLIHHAPSKLPEADLYITNSDNPWVERIASAPPDRRTWKAICLKLSHNPRFKAEECLGLRQSWDAVVCSTQWLADACTEPQKVNGWDHPPVKADVIGWWHYEHARFRCAPNERSYGDGSAERPFAIGTLIHSHPLKGTAEALRVMQALTKARPDLHFRFVGIGEVPPRAVPSMPGLEYGYELSREELAATMKGLDVWLSASRSEGLGRMTLEAMSAGASVIATDTGSEHLKGTAQLVMLVSPQQVVHDMLGHLSFWLASPTRSSWTGAFETAERASDPTPCIDRLEEVIQSVF